MRLYRHAEDSLSDMDGQLPNKEVTDQADNLLDNTRIIIKKLSGGGNVVA